MPPLTKKKTYTPYIALPFVISSSMFLASQAFAAPTANADNYATTSGKSITFNPLSNDRADRGTTFFVETVNNPRSGTVSKSGNNITYTAPANFTGSTTFWYGIKDSRGLITSAPIKVTVTAGTGGGGGGVPSTSPPQAYGDYAKTTSGQRITIDVIKNDAGNGLFINSLDTPKPSGSGSSEL